MGYPNLFNCVFVVKVACAVMQRTMNKTNRIKNFYRENNDNIFLILTQPASWFKGTLVNQAFHSLNEESI